MADQLLLQVMEWYEVGSYSFDKLTSDEVQSAKIPFHAERPDFNNTEVGRIVGWNELVVPGFLRGWKFRSRTCQNPCNAWHHRH